MCGPAAVRRLASAAVRAHARPTKRTGIPTPGVLGVRREDKNKWERRVPVAPRHVQQLVEQGLKVIVQPSARRVFTDEEYKEVGAVVQEDLSECSAIVAVKEVPLDLLLPGRTWCFFSHTIKAQPSGMPLLDAVLEKKVRLIDYECITASGQRGGHRLVAFGAFAGYAGAIDFLRGLGERILALGFSTPLLHIGSAFMYPDLQEARRAVSMAGDSIRKRGLPAALSPFVAVFTGSGNVTNGALEIFKLLPHEMVDPSELPKLCESGRADPHKLYLSVATAQHMVKRRDGGPFDKAHYYAEPEKYESTFQDNILPYCSVVLNGMYWDARFPRLFTHEDIHRHVVTGHDRLLGVCDITCDADGSVPTRQFSSIEQPFYIYNALTEQISTCLDEPGVLFHAVDHLPSELPRESSEHFGDALLPFLPQLAMSVAPESPGRSDSHALPAPVRGAIVAEGGRLTRDYQYIQQLRSVQEQVDHSVQDEAQAERDALRPHGVVTGVPADVTIELTGHIFDTRLINTVCDLAEARHVKIEILLIEVGAAAGNESFVSFRLHHRDEKLLSKVVKEITVAATEARCTLRRAVPDGNSVGSSLTEGDDVTRTETLAASARRPRRNVVVLGAGYVSPPLVNYMLRRPENAVTVVSIQQREVDALAERCNRHINKEVLDITSTSAGAAEAREAIVKAADVIISVVPASLHAGVARLAVKHRKPMVTASYVSEEMQALDEEAKAAGVLILNEAGLDPGIDHMSAMKMIDAATAGGSRILRFASLCGGLPAPEAAGSNPLAYKFSWSPKGVILASRNPARFREEGQLREVHGEDLLAHARPLTLNGALAFDVLPNRDSTVFAELYGLADAPSFFRGTLRYRGFCERMLALARLGMLASGPVEGLSGSAAELDRRTWLTRVLQLPQVGSTSELRDALRSRLRERGVDGASAEVGVDFINWLGLLEDQPLPTDAPADSPIDVVTRLLQRPETAYRPGERDMVAMRHELDVERPDGVLERHTATLVDYGEPFGDTIMAKTVGLTAAICGQLVLDGPERFGVGMQRPLRKVWYDPVLVALEAEGVRLDERVEIVKA